MRSSNFQNIVGPILTKAYSLSDMKLEKEWSKVFKVEQGIKSNVQEDTVLAGLGLAALKPENSSIAFSEGGQSYVKSYRFKVFALAFHMSDELIEDGADINILMRYVNDLADSMHQTEEIYHAGIFNNAFNTGGAYAGGDGKPLLATDHPLYDAGETFSNKLAIPADLSVASLEAIRTQIRLAPNERGQRISLKADKLVVPPDLYFDATRILESTLQSGTANNDINALKSTGTIPGGICEMTYLTNPDAYFVTTNCKRGLIHLDRGATKKGMEKDFHRGGKKYKVSKRFEAGWTDPRGVFGSEGVA